MAQVITTMVRQAVVADDLRTGTNARTKASERSDANSTTQV